MTPNQWITTINAVADAMLAHTRPFGTPLGTATADAVRLVGSGAYVRRDDRRILLTCEHVTRTQPLHYRFHGSDDVFEHRGAWVMDEHPIDAAFADISDAAWDACVHQAAEIPYERFAPRHRPAQPEELLFFRGYAGENARYAFGIHQTNATGYCTQEKKGTGDDQIFELFWEPQQSQFTFGTSAEALAEMKLDDARGFSGSLVWNTRYLEVTGAGGKWSPTDAVVTGLVRRWDQQTKTLLAWRVEHLRAWLDAKFA